MLCVRQWSVICRAGGQGQVLANIHCREPKTGQQEVQLCSESDPLCPSSYTIYLWVKFTKTRRKNPFFVNKVSYKLKVSVEFKTEPN